MATSGGGFPASRDGFAVRFRHVPLAAAALAVSATLLLGGCGADFTELGGPSFSAVNNTSQVLHFRIYGEGGRLYDLVSPIEPNREGEIMGPHDFSEFSTLTKNGCTFGDILALNSQDREVARRPPPVCGGEKWVIEEPGPSSS